MRTENTQNNYEKWCAEWEKRFLTLDQDELLLRIPGLEADGDCLVLLYFSQRYGINRRTGEIAVLETEREATIPARLNIYTLLWYCRKQAALAHEWVPFRNLRDASPFGPAFQRTVVDVFAGTFAGHMKELETACQTLGGIRLPHSDMGYQIPAFACIPVQFLFWDRDEEFPAQANILFDASAADFVHVESLVTIASEGLALMSEIAGLPLASNTFA